MAWSTSTADKVVAGKTCAGQACPATAATRSQQTFQCLLAMCSFVAV